MSRPEETDEHDEMLPEYEFSDGVRGKYAGRFSKGAKVVQIEPELSEQFPTSKAVNDALREIVEQRRRNAG
jgi:hypothetical protein